ncbi:unnamed protein product [Cuscuta europaea]|uniref:Integrase catalytic domain-containing protein n=1 Tax=Cuscuta europaea TaxID=41803 RepID=A0A9P0Z2G7_CUSEU|nr:unnamed protein product [Cuscuta europaea]
MGICRLKQESEHRPEMHGRRNSRKKSRDSIDRGSFHGLDWDNFPFREMGTFQRDIQKRKAGTFQRDGERGIDHNFSAPRTHQQYGVVERKNRTLEDMTRTMLISNGLARNFWAEALNTACYIINRAMIRPLLRKMICTN